MRTNEKTINLEKFKEFKKLNALNIRKVREGKKGILVIFDKYKNIQNILFEDRDEIKIRFYKAYFDKHYNHSYNIKKVYISESWGEFISGEMWDEFGKIEGWAESPRIAHDPADYIQHLFNNYDYIGTIETKIYK